MEKTYNPKQVEERLYNEWMDKGYFTPERDPDKKPFTIVIPPPNVTGQLHMGHAVDETFQDILIRYKRMQGFSTLWLPGTDHAGIATQIKVEEALRNEEGLTRHDLGREKFLQKVWEWKYTYGNRIINQLKKLGSSCDWTRERFTMDDGCSEAVKEVFVKLYNKGIIYKGHRIINWCPSCSTALSDAEVEYKEKDGNFWHIKYPVKNSDQYVVVATTRPETMLGDTAVAVHPDDPRYSNLVGKMLILPLIGREIPIIADQYVDKDFGTGAVKITPAHDPNDFEVGIRHNLEQIKVMNDDASINKLGGKYAGMDRYSARAAIIEDLIAADLLIKTEDHKHNVGQCYRCDTTVEPITSDQWFVRMEPLAKEAIRVVEDEAIKFVPKRFGKIYLNWMENVHDWCISRQLWWGHRIPAYYCENCEHMQVSSRPVLKCERCGEDTYQDSDVLDTWFSSALWPFSTLGWPEQTEDLKYFYPTDVLVTSYDIIFFWVARMIFSGLEHTNQPPFKYVFIHGLMRDSKGKKMSKSAGNGIDPLEIIEQYGADALRFSIATGNSPGNDMRFYTEKVEWARNFANKIWNASRFVLMNLEQNEQVTDSDGQQCCTGSGDKSTVSAQPNLSIVDKWILSRYNTVVAEVTENLDKFELGIAVQKLYDFIWDEFCDWYIELCKPSLYGKVSDGRLVTQKVLVHVLSGTLKLLHPFMPFITEEIWLQLPRNNNLKAHIVSAAHGGNPSSADCVQDAQAHAPSIMVSEWPVYDAELNFAQDQQNMIMIMDVVKSIRNIRTEMNVHPAQKANVYVITPHTQLFEGTGKFLQRLAGAAEVFVELTSERLQESVLKNAVHLITSGAEIFIPLDQLVDMEKERERLEKEKAFAQDEIKRVDSKLNNQGFISKAPPQLVEQERKKKEKYTKMLEKITESLKKL